MSVFKIWWTKANVRKLLERKIAFELSRNITESYLELLGNILMTNRVNWIPRFLVVCVCFVSILPRSSLAEQGPRLSCLWSSEGMCDNTYNVSLTRSVLFFRNFTNVIFLLVSPKKYLRIIFVYVIFRIWSNSAIMPSLQHFRMNSYAE